MPPTAAPDLRRVIKSSREYTDQISMNSIIRLPALVICIFSGFFSLVLAAVMGWQMFNSGPQDVSQTSVIAFVISAFVFGGTLFALRKTKPIGRLNEDPEAKEVRENFTSLLNQNHLVTTYAIGSVLILVYAALVILGKISITPTVAQLYEVGGGYGRVTAHGEAWRILTPMFLHGSIMHLIGNLMGLWAAGRLLDFVVGWRSYLAIYFLSGVIAAIASAATYPDNVSVGASGAIFGLYGALLSALIFSGRLRSAKVPRSLFVMAGFQAFNSLTAGFSMSGTDNAAHVGGLVGGFLITCAWYINKNDVTHRVATFSISAVLSAAVVFVVIPRMIPRTEIMPLTSQQATEAIGRSIDEIERLELVYHNKLHSKTETEQQKVDWIRTSFLPTFSKALESLRQTRGAGANELAVEARAVVLETAGACHIFYHAVANVREPASTALPMEFRQKAEACINANEFRKSFYERTGLIRSAPSASSDQGTN